MLCQKNNSKYEYACAMLYFDSDQIHKFHEQISEEDVFVGEEGTYGLEDHPHLTLLYGLDKSVCSASVIDNIQKFDLTDFVLTKVSTFPTRDECPFEVLKFDVECPILHNINQDLRECFPYTNPFDYHPHITIAYLKKGTSAKYIAMFADNTFTAIPTTIVYNYNNGCQEEATPIDINKLACHH